MSNEKNKVEAVLFACSRWMGIQEISEITGINDLALVQSALAELKADCETRVTPVMLSELNNQFKLALKDHYLPIAQKVVTQTELDKPLMETLAVIAWKYPILQAQVIRIRHNKAYEHLRILEEMGFILRQKFGRTNKLTLTQKFFEYFDLPSKDQISEVFKNVVPDDIKKKLEQEEKEIEEGEKKIIEAEEKKAAAKESVSSEQGNTAEEIPKQNSVKEEIDILEKKEEDKIENIKKDEAALEKQEEKKDY